MKTLDLKEFISLYGTLVETHTRYFTDILANVKGTLLQSALKSAMDKNEELRKELQELKEKLLNGCK